VGAATLFTHTARASRLAGVVARIAGVAGWLVAVGISLLISPAGYAGTPLDRLADAISADVVGGSARLGADAGLTLLVTWLWWRGLLLGRMSLTRERLHMRFLWGLAAMILAIASVATVQAASRTNVTAELSALLPCRFSPG